MKIVSLSLLTLTVALCSGCVPSPSQPDPAPTFNPNAEFAGNVSTLYDIGAVPADGSLIDVQWKDSLGTVRSLKADSGKAVVVTFWSTTNTFAASEIAAADSVAATMGDSVKVLGIATDKTLHSFVTVYSYVATHGIHSQIVIDSTSNAFHEYLELIDDQSIYLPETFIFKPNGELSDVLQGYFTEADLLDHTRKAWQ